MSKEYKGFAPNNTNRSNKEKSKEKSKMKDLTINQSNKEKSEMKDLRINQSKKEKSEMKDLRINQSKKEKSKMKDLTINYCIKVLNKPAFPISPREALINNKQPKAPAYYQSKTFFSSLNWKGFQDWHTLQDSIKEEVLKKWHADDRIEGVSTIGGWNGKHWIAWIDFDVKNFNSVEDLNEQVRRWMKKNHLEKTPQFKTPSGGYRVLVAFKEEPIEWGANNGFTLTPMAPKRHGELLTKNGGHTLLPPTVGTNGIAYEWSKEPRDYPRIVDAPHSIDLFTLDAPTYQEKSQHHARHSGKPQAKPVHTNIIANKDLRIEIQEAEECLKYISPDEPYEEWLKVGASLYSLDSGLIDLFDRWSSTGSKYTGYKEIEQKWRSFEKGTTVKISWLIKKAIENGFDAKAWWVKQNENQCQQKKNVTVNRQTHPVNVEVKKENINPNPKPQQPVPAEPDRPKKRKMTAEEKTAQATIEIKAYIAENNIVAREIKRVEICRKWGFSNQAFNLMAQSLDSKASKKKARLLTHEELMALEEDQALWLFPRFVPSTGVTVLAGEAGAGKTTLAYHLAGCLSEGSEFLGEKPVNAGEILIVSSDEPYPFARDKIINRGIEGKYKMLLDWNVSDWGTLEDTLEQDHPKLVIVDSFRAINCADDFDENSSLASSCINKLNALSIKYSCAFVLIHHIAKDKELKGVNKLRGSSAIAAAASAIWILEGAGQMRKLTQPKIRGGVEPLNLTLELIPEDGSFKMINGNGDTTETKSLASKLLSFFQQRVGKYYEIIELQQFFPDSKSALYKSLQRLVQRGQLSIKPSKNNRKIKVWGIKPKGDSCNDNTPKPCSTLQPEVHIDKVESEIDTPPTHSLSNMSNKDKTLTQSRFAVVDTYSTDSGHSLDTENMSNSESLTQCKVPVVDTLDRMGGCESCPQNEILQADQIQTNILEQEEQNTTMNEKQKLAEEKSYFTRRQEQNLKLKEGDRVRYFWLGSYAPGTVTKVKRGVEKILTIELDDTNKYTVDIKLPDELLIPMQDEPSVLH